MESIPRLLAAQSKTVTGMNKWNMFCNLYSHECNEPGGSHLGSHTPKGYKGTATHGRSSRQGSGATTLMMSFQTPSLCSSCLCSSS